MIDVRNLHVYYGMIEAVKGISFSVQTGQIVSLIGSNGAGKRGQGRGSHLRTVLCAAVRAGDRESRYSGQRRQ